MGLGVSRTVGTNAIPVFQGEAKDIQLAQGGFLLTNPVLPADTVIPAGTPVVFNETTRACSILSWGILHATAGGSDTDYQVKKGHLFKVGHPFATGAAGGKAYAITAIDTTTSSVYDIITVGTTIGAATAGDLMYASTATGATASAYPSVNGLLYSDVVSGAGVSVSVVIRGTVYARRTAYNSTLATALSGKITYSQSK